jgi:hypothetical protein
MIGVTLAPGGKPFNPRWPIPGWAVEVSMKIAEALKLEPGMPLSEISGTILKVGKYHSGVSEYGPWSFQTVTIKDETGMVAVKLKNHHEIPVKAVGEPFTAKAVKTEVNKPPSGVLRAVDEYRGKQTPLIMVEPKATVTIGNGENLDEPLEEGLEHIEIEEDVPEDMKPTPGYEKIKATQETGSKPNDEAKSDQAVARARIALGKAANGLLLAFDAAAYVARSVKEKHGVELTPDALERIAVHLSIMLERNGHLLEMPHGPIKK